MTSDRIGKIDHDGQEPTVSSRGRIDKLNIRWYKRPFDLTILIVAHVMLAPVWLIVWTVIPLSIWLEDKGPIFYFQNRVGHDGRVFRLRKFRTMVPDADRIGPGWTATADARITRVGRILRRTALDELPQVINIVRGELSLVGPRALPPAMHEEMSNDLPRFRERLKVKPGLTGLAQVFLPRTCPPRRRLAYDLYYIKRRSLGLDVYIMVKSVTITLLGSWDVGPRQGIPEGKEYREHVPGKGD